MSNRDKWLDILAKDVMKQSHMTYKDSLAAVIELERVGLLIIPTVGFAELKML